jgi:PIN domain nuclease of toxin-antitoxin system
LQQQAGAGLGVSAISCWEIAKLDEHGKIKLSRPLDDWFAQALGPSAIQLLSLTPEIAVESTRLQKPFHKEPADQIIVATACVLNCPLATCDLAIRAYPHVQLLL